MAARAGHPMGTMGASGTMGTMGTSGTTGTTGPRAPNPILDPTRGLRSFMSALSPTAERVLRAALESNGQRFTEQRAAVFGFLSSTSAHPTADEVYHGVRSEVPGISLATVYKSLEALVGCGLATKLTYGDGSARYDGRTDLHHHARCLNCDCVVDVHGDLPDGHVAALQEGAAGFHVTGYRLELLGYCEHCAPHASGVAEA